ncbi:MAG: helicase-exonuclease AddAB subunit AddA [Pseudobutyrivibrio sp.]|nr:helicase-exonuclease AddAB subunit AddA [Pseudobutyrivibrio sp.]
MGLTKEQTLVRDTRNKNMLVSAAAGSGKTYVLVQRIITEILDKENGIDVDRILVVTFTNAAAAEMKDRIRKAIDDAVVENISDSRIRTQATLIHNAHIRTIDSFCNWVVKNYFYEIDQDPGFRIGTSGEMKMLEDEVFSDLLGQKLEEADEDFMLLADAYISGRNTSKLANLVFELHDKASSFPWVNEWYDQALKLYDYDSIDEMESSLFIDELLTLSNKIIDNLIERLRPLVKLYDEDCGSKDKTIFSNELVMMCSLRDANTYTDKRAILQGMTFDRFASKGTCLNEDELAKAKELRDLYKSELKTLKESYYNLDLEELFDCMMFVKRQATALISLSKDYAKNLSETKAKKNIFNFNDIEHMALEILRNKDSKEHEKRPVAIELTNHFKEVMVDEYQDSNELQEQILTAISNGSNYFTVGDVKQSIYAFRQADPQLFIDKLNTYPMDDSSNSIRIDLDKNFRSRKQVLEFCNQVFAPMMQADMGGVSYDEKAALKVGDETFKGDENDYVSELLIAEEDSDAMAELGLSNNDELEANMVAAEISKLMSTDYMISAKGESGERELRPLRLSDIVIIMRATTGHADVFINVLKSKGIAAYVAEEKGFFDREEIETVLSMLQVIDNPFNDIPLAAVLHSPMFGFTSEELAKIKASYKDESLYASITKYHEENTGSKKLNRFFELLNQFRDQVMDTPIHEMIENVLKDTGYGIYVSALPQGKGCTANLDKLIDEAVNFESTSYKGLSRFVRYIEGLRTYDEDLGLAKTVSESDDAVRIMTIHKSKGLEFPIVFVSGCGRGIQKENGAYYYDKKLGLALNYLNPNTRITYKTPFSNVVRARLNADSKGEYLRILYVALTRAVDKLYITGCIKPTKDKSCADIVESYSANSSVLDYLSKANSNSSLELIIRSLNASGVSFKKHIYTCQELFTQEVKDEILRQHAKLLIDDMLKNIDDNAGEDIHNNLNFEYEGLSDSSYKSKYSVSEIKHQAMEDAFGFNQDAAPAFVFHEEEAYVPAFMRSVNTDENHEVNAVPAGALYGTAMHRFMECFDFTEDDYKNSFKSQLEYMTSTGAMPPEENALINHRKLGTFISSDIANRMHKAALNGKLFKEKPFVFGATAKDLFDDNNDSGEMILVQGIIDVFFEEEDGLVLLDYKTDRVDEASELVVRYEKQLQLYKDAIEKAYNTPVKDVIIYSFSLDKEITLCMTN